MKDINMKKIEFIMKRLTDMDYKAMFETISDIHKKTGKNRFCMLCDVVYCGFKYGAGYSDYKYFEFYTLNSQQRATYITRATNNVIAAHCNKKEFYHCLNDKVEFNEKYGKFLKRDWLDFRTAQKEDFMKFIDGKTAIIVKPVDLTCGQGVEKLNVSDFESYEAMYDKLKTMPNAQLLEDYVVQHQKMSEIYPYSVNTCRITTLLKGDDVYMMSASLRIGNNAKVVDNLHDGGMMAPINIETGVVSYSACDKQGYEYEKHPMTGTSIRGFEVPYWNEILDMCRVAAKITPEVRYSGWDVAITENGPVFIEGNHLPAYDLVQTPPSQQNPKVYGMLPVYREILKGELDI